MKKALPYLVNALVLLLGAGLLAYPSFSNTMHQSREAQLITAYREQASEMDIAMWAEERAKAEEYNRLLTGTGLRDPFVPGTGMVLPDNYVEVLHTDSIMGLLEIPAIDVYLGIYHGAGPEVLDKGVGHLELTAFPIGGEGNHSVLTAHSGLAKAKLFTDLPQLQVGDSFYIHILGEVLAYEIDQTLVVEPQDIGALRPTAGQDYVTLVTCTPYGVNTHRLLVRGHRVPYTPKEHSARAAGTGKQALYLPWQYLVAGGALLLCAASLHGVLLRRRRRAGQGKNTHYKKKL